LGVLVLYLVLPLVIESLIAGGVQTALGTSTKPDVEVSSDFPPMMLLGSIGRVRVSLEQISLEQINLSEEGGVAHDASADLQGVSVSVPSLIVGDPSIEAERCFFKARVEDRYGDVQDKESRVCPSELSGSSSP
jgi:hypothetical protein